MKLTLVRNFYECKKCGRKDAGTAYKSYKKRYYYLALCECCGYHKEFHLNTDLINYIFFIIAFFSSLIFIILGTGSVLTGNNVLTRIAIVSLVVAILAWIEVKKYSPNTL